MTLRALGVLQWLGLFVGAAAWAGMHVVGYGVTEASCNIGGTRWGIRNDVWQATLMAIGVLVILSAGAAALAVLAGTRSASYEDEPPEGRIRFLAIAALAANLIFLVIVLLDGFASILAVQCRQS